MPKPINIPNVGTVNFPDDMDDAQISDAIKRNIMPKYGQSSFQHGVGAFTDVFGGMAKSFLQGSLPAERQANLANQDPVQGIKSLNPIAVNRFKQGDISGGVGESAARLLMQFGPMFLGGRAVARGMGPIEPSEVRGPLASKAPGLPAEAGPATLEGRIGEMPRQATQPPAVAPNGPMPGPRPTPQLPAAPAADSGPLLSLTGEILPPQGGSAADVKGRPAYGHTPEAQAHAPNTEWMPIDQLKKFQEFNREVTPKWKADPNTDIGKLSSDIKKNGLSEPLMMEYSPSENKALLTEGNHRLAAMDRAGFTEAPVRVYRRDGSMFGKGVDVSGYGKDGVIPTDMKPSDIGIQTVGKSHMPQGTPQEPLTGPPTINALATQAVGSDVYKQPGEIIKPEGEEKFDEPKTIDATPPGMVKRAPLSDPRADKAMRLVDSAREERFSLERALATGRANPPPPGVKEPVPQSEDERKAQFQATVKNRIGQLKQQEAQSLATVARYSKSLPWDKIATNLEQKAALQLAQASAFQQHIQSDRNVQILTEKLQNAKPKERLKIMETLGYEKRATDAPQFLNASIVKPEVIEKVNAARALYTERLNTVIQQMQEKGYLNKEGMFIGAKGAMLNSLDPKVQANVKADLEKARPGAKLTDDVVKQEIARRNREMQAEASRMDALRHKFHDTLFRTDENGVRQPQVFMLREQMTKAERDLANVKISGDKAILTTQAGSFGVQEGTKPSIAELSLDTIRKFMGLTQKSRVLGKLTSADKDMLDRAPADQRRAVFNEIVRQHFQKVVDRIRETGEHNANLAKAVRVGATGDKLVRSVYKPSADQQTIQQERQGQGPNYIQNPPSAPKSPTGEQVEKTQSQSVVSDPEGVRPKAQLTGGPTAEASKPVQAPGAPKETGESVQGAPKSLAELEAQVKSLFKASDAEAQAALDKIKANSSSPREYAKALFAVLKSAPKPTLQEPGYRTGKGLSKTIGPKPPKGSDPTEQGFIRLSMLWPGSWFNNPVRRATLAISNQEMGRTIMNYRMAEAALDHEQNFHKFEEMAKAHNSDSVTDLQRLFDAAERKPGYTPMPPVEQAATDAIQQAYQMRWDLMKHLGIVEHDSIPDYFRRLFKGRISQNIVQRIIMQKRPFEGTKGFIRQRAYEWFSEALQAGADPVTNNFFEMQLLGLHQVDKFVAAHMASADFKKAGIAKWFKNSDLSQGKVPDGWRAFEDRIFQPMVYKEGGFTKYGQFWGPAEVVKDFHNFLSPGLRDNDMFNIFRKYGETLNRVQLGFSAFHAGFTAATAATTDLANAMVAMNRGGSALKYVPGAIARSAIPGASVVSYAWTGARFKEAALDPSSHPDLAPWVKYWLMGGGRMGLDPMWKLNSVSAFWKDWTSPKFWGKFKAVGLDLPMMMSEKVMAPIMEKLVPNAKMGAALQMMKIELPGLEARGASQAEIAVQMGKIMRSVDNRFGQLVYDNYHINKIMKDLGMSLTRSLGWNLGSVDEIGQGNTTDIKNMIKKGDPLNWRTTFLPALFIVAGVWGSLLHLGLHGTLPRKLKDAYVVPTGYVGENGEEVKLQLPTYMKDVFSVIHDPAHTALSKLNPSIETIAQLIDNHDYYGHRIVQPYDDPLTKLGKRALFAGPLQAEPLASRNIRNMLQNDQPAWIAAGSFVGVTPAPRWMSMTKAQALATELTEDTFSKGNFDKGTETARLRAALRSHDPQRIQEAAKHVSSAQFERAFQDMNKSDLVRKFERIPNPEGALAVWNEADRDERTQLIEPMLKQVEKLANRPEDERQRLMPKFEEALRNR